MQYTDLVEEVPMGRGQRSTGARRTTSAGGQVLVHGNLDEIQSVIVYINMKMHSPILQNTRAIWSTKLNSERPDISLVPLAVCSVLERSWENSNARLGSS